jgi:tRNA (guanine-N7-)-methyltransferase
MGEGRPRGRSEASGFLIEPESENESQTSGAVAGRRRALYGRAHGKALRSYHAALVRNVLPQLEIGSAPRLDCGALFSFRPQEIWLEIGFGGGEHLIAQAAARRDIGFLGAEPFVNGVAKALAGIEREKLDNVRLRAGDAGALLEALPDGALSRVFILYPDPWPKRRHNKRRFISDERVEDFARVLRAGGEARFATDIDDYAGWTLRRFLDSARFQWPARKADDWRQPWSDWRETRYEAKAKREGRKPVYLSFIRA